MIQRRISVTLLACLAAASQGIAAHAATYNVRNAPYNAYGDGVHNDYQAIQNAVTDAINAGPNNTVSIPSGTYLLNTGNSIYINNTNGLTVQGSSTTKLINGQQNDYISINGSTNVNVNQLTMDTQPLRSTQGTVNSVAPNGLSVTVTLDPGYQALNAPMFSVASVSNPIDCFFWTDPNSLCFDRNLGGNATATGFTLISGSQWTVNLNSAVNSSVVGKKVAILNEGGGWPISINDNTGPINVTDLTYYGGGGSGAIIGMNRNLGPITLQRIVDCAPPGSGRLLASAGGFTAQSNRGHITIDHCDISRTKDDILDTGTDLSHILSHPSGNVINVENMANYYSGDTVQLWDWTNQQQKVRDTATITGVVHNGDGTWTLTLDHNVTVAHTGAGPGDTNWSAQEADGIDRVCDLNNAAPVTVTNCRMQDSGRIFVLKCPNSNIENNTFYQTPWCIFAAAETFWHGGPAPTGITIRNNTFQDIDIAPIEFETRYSTVTGSCKNILVEGNRFQNCGAHSPFSDGVYGPQTDIRGGGVSMRNTDTATIRNNIFDENWGAPITVQASSNITIAGNVFKNSHKHTWSNYNNYGVNQSADIYLDNSATVNILNNLTLYEGPYLTSNVIATASCTGVTGATTGVTTGTGSLSAGGQTARIAWFKADAITGVANGGAVNTWTDSSGHSNNAVKVGNAPTLATTAINRLPVVHFNAASSQYLKLSRFVQDDFTIFCVFRSTQGIGTSTDFPAGAGLVSAEVPGSVNDFGTCLNANGLISGGTGNPDVSVYSPNGYTDGTAHLMTFRRIKSTGLIAIFVDGKFYAQANAGTTSLTSPTQIVLGAQQVLNNFLTGDIAEVQIFNAALSDNDRFVTEQQLLGKWGIGLTTGTLSSRAVWLKADAITGLANGAAVNTWSDFSGNGTNAVKVGNAPTYATSAMNSLPVVRFTAASSQYLNVPRTVQDDFTILAVFRSSQGLGSGSQFYNGAGIFNAEVPGVVNDFGTCLFSNGALCAGVGNPDTSTSSATGYNDGKAHLLTMKRIAGSGTIALSVDGKLAGVTNGGSQSLTSPTQITLGALGSIGNFLNGDISEVQIYNSATPDIEQAAVEYGLINKWNVGF